jgi:hypothetical protein
MRGLFQLPKVSGVASEPPQPSPRQRSDTLDPSPGFYNNQGAVRCRARHRGHLRE